jgi:hypothetical protein
MVTVINGHSGQQLPLEMNAPQSIERERGGAAAWPAINGPRCPSVTGELKRIGNGREAEGIESVGHAGASLLFDGRGLKEGRAHDTGETGRRRRL